MTHEGLKYEQTLVFCQTVWASACRRLQTGLIVLVRRSVVLRLYDFYRLCKGTFANISVAFWGTLNSSGEMGHLGLQALPIVQLERGQSSRTSRLVMGSVQRALQNMHVCHVCPNMFVFWPRAYECGSSVIHTVHASVRTTSGFECTTSASATVISTEIRSTDVFTVGEGKSWLNPTFAQQLCKNQRACWFLCDCHSQCTMVSQPQSKLGHQAYMRSAQ